MKYFYKNGFETGKNIQKQAEIAPFFAVFDKKNQKDRVYMKALFFLKGAAEDFR